MSHKKITMDELIEQLEKSEKERNYSDDILDFNNVEVEEFVAIEENYSFDRLKQLMEEIKRSYNVSVDTPIPGRGVKAIVKKVLRKLFIPVIRPMNEQQVAFNQAVVQCLNQIFLYIEENNESSAAHCEGVEIYKRLDNIEKAEEELATRILLLEETNK